MRCSVDPRRRMRQPATSGLWANEWRWSPVRAGRCGICGSPPAETVAGAAARRCSSGGLRAIGRSVRFTKVRQTVYTMGGALALGARDAFSIGRVGTGLGRLPEMGLRDWFCSPGECWARRPQGVCL